MPTYPDCSYVSVDDTSEPTGASYIYCLAAEVRELKRAAADANDLAASFPIMAPSTACDSHWANVVFLLNGTDVTDQSTAGTAITNTGITSSGGAYQCNATGQLDTTTNSANFDMFAVDSTIDFFIKRSSTAYGAIFGQNAGYNLIGMSVSGPLNVTVATAVVLSVAVPSADVWHHIEVTHRQSDRYMEMYVDGIIADTGTATGTPPGGMNMTWLGEQTSGAPPRLGYGGLVEVSGVRITRGVIRHTEDFDPPTAPFYEVACL